MNSNSAGSLLVERAFSRSLLWKLASEMFHYPVNTTFQWLNQPELWQAVITAARDLNYEETASVLAGMPDCMIQLSQTELEHAYIQTFGHTVRAASPPYETEWGLSESLLAPHMLADLSAFYRAHGLRIADREERPDHVSVECEFVCFLTFKEATALTKDDTELAALCADSTKKFLAEHVAGFVPTFTRRLAAASDSVPYNRFAKYLRSLLLAEAREYQFRTGDDDLPLRALSFDDKSECISCSLNTTSDAPE